MTNDYRERLDQAIQTTLVALLKYPPSGVRVDRAYGGSCDVTFTLPDAYSAQVLGPLYAAMHAHEPPAEEPEKFVLPDGWVSGVPLTATTPPKYSRRLPASQHHVVVVDDGHGSWRCFDTKPGTKDWFRMSTMMPLATVLREADRVREERFVRSLDRPPTEEPKKLGVPPYGATVDNSPPLGSMYRGWRVCGASETTGRFYLRASRPAGRTSYTVAWTGTDWSLCADCVNYPLGKGSLDEALDRAKEMMR